MKTHILSSILFTGLALIASSLPARADVDTAWITYEQTAREIRALHRQLGVGQVVANVELVLTKKIQEVVTEKGSTSSSARAGFFGGASSSQAWDVTKMIVQNPEEVAKFDRTETVDFGKARGVLLKYIEDNELSLIRFKALAIQNLAAYYELEQAGQVVSRADYEETVRLATELSFLGQHNVTRCVATSFAARSKSTSESGSQVAIPILSLFFGSFSNRSYWEQIPHTVTECKSNTNQLEMNANATVFKVSLTRMDAEIAKWVRANAVLDLGRSSAPVYPSWGSPYYK